MKISASFHALRLPSLLLGVAMLPLLAPDLALAQCALCRDAAASSSPQTQEGMNHAIISLALAPYGVVALAAWVLSPNVREAVRSGLRRLGARTRGAGR